MKHNNIIIMSVLALVISLTGCGNINKLSEYDMTGISFIEYNDIDTVCEDKELITAGSNLLSGQEDNLLLSYVVDSAIELSAELGDYDHLVFTNPKWIENFGDSGKLKPIEYSSLSKSMQQSNADIDKRRRCIARRNRVIRIRRWRSACISCKCNSWISEADRSKKSSGYANRQSGRNTES